MSRRKPKNRIDTGAPEWMTTFSDLMTLLLTFFVLLYSFSTLDALKFKNIANALQSALTGQGAVTIFENDSPPGNIPVEDIEQPPDNDGEILNEEIASIYETVENFIEEEGLEAEVTLRADRRGVIIDIKDTILFDPGKAELKQNSKEVLDKITLLINEFDNEIIVEGHTDTVPINTYRFPTNWELSTTRATNVVRYFIEERHIDPTRMSVAGYGEYQPIAPNDTPKNKSLNRRVNILIVSS